MTGMGSRWRLPRVRAAGTGQAQASGGVAVSGNLIVDGDLVAGPPVQPAHTGYLEQIRRIAPPELRDRAEELAELAAFCTGPSEYPYRWLRGPAWAGKSALLSWFALNPPAGVQLVPFFVTGRFAGQNDRLGFCEVVTEQLSAFLGRPVPARMTDATCDGHVLSLIHEAADVCAENGTRLVLLVDGLDEDQGVTARPESYSIAALLPSRPRAGLRVIVTSRLRPPVPSDVPDDHPLREPRVVRELSVSPHAQAVRADAERELQRLAAAPKLEREILGLVTAADGGLTTQDLAELTGTSVFTLGRHLGTVAGRTFTTLLSPWTREEVYVLGHDELRTSALQVLSGSDVAGHRERLHRWAEDYRDEGWPARTPEYLLHGYFRTLQLTHDLPRAVAQATDYARHDRMLQVTGSDAAGLAEINAAQELLLGQDTPDLLAMARLAIHRDRLRARSDNAPVALPSLWAALGAVDRAESVLSGITAPARHGRALLALVEALLAAGEFDRARTLADSALRPEIRSQALAMVVAGRCGTGDLAGAEEVTALIEDPQYRVAALGSAIKAAMDAGNPAEAERLAACAQAHALTVANPSRRASAIRNVSVLYAQLNDHDRAVGLARLTPEPIHRVYTLSTLAADAAKAGDHDRWRLLSTEAESTARALTQPVARVKHLAALARTAAQIDQRAHARVLARDAAESLEKVKDPAERTAALVSLIAALVATGDPELARLLTRSIATPDKRIMALLNLVDGGAVTASECLAELPLVEGDDIREGPLIALVWRAALGLRQPDLAEAVAERIHTPATRLHLLVRLARRYAADGAHERADRLGVEVSELSRSLTDRQEQVEVMTALALLDVSLGRTEQARRTADTAQSHLRDFTGQVVHQSRAMLNLARAMTAMGDAKRARELGSLAEDLALEHGLEEEGAKIRAELLELAMAASDLTWASGLAREVPEPRRRALTLLRVARAWADAGVTNRALDLLPEIEAGIDGLPDNRRSRPLVDLARLLAHLGRPERAEQAACRIPDPQQRVAVFLELAQQVPDPHAKRLLARVLGTTSWAESLAGMASMAPSVVQAVADEQLAENPDSG
ncbi:hypothetical protein [Kitasatospora griseola]|uniref:hypothetical protein n=1 Tax=Kitasatospora griseola TaxID=2064 RepID=UPI0036466512